MNFNPREKTSDVGNKSRQNKGAMPPEKVRNAIAPKRMQTGIAKDYFKTISGCRVAGKNGLNIFFKSFKHLTILLHFIIHECTRI